MSEAILIENCQKFEDTTGTIFEKGPHELLGETYDYKLTDELGVDYCNKKQLDMWGVQLKTVLEG